LLTHIVVLSLHDIADVHAHPATEKSLFTTARSLHDVPAPATHAPADAQNPLLPHCSPLMHAAPLCTRHRERACNAHTTLTSAARATSGALEIARRDGARVTARAQQTGCARAIAVARAPSAA
jgi:hypothetical protein